MTPTEVRLGYEYYVQFDGDRDLYYATGATEEEAVNQATRRRQAKSGASGHVWCVMETEGVRLLLLGRPDSRFDLVEEPRVPGPVELALRITEGDEYLIHKAALEGTLRLKNPETGENVLGVLSPNAPVQSGDDLWEVERRRYAGLSMLRKVLGFREHLRRRAECRRCVREVSHG